MGQCEKFSAFVLGRHILLETDHKPLVPLLGTKNLHCLPPRILRFHYLDRFSFDVKHVPGKELYTADILSRAPVHHNISFDTTQLLELAEQCVPHVISHLPAGCEKVDTYRKAQSKDSVFNSVIQYCHTGWPHWKDLDPSVKYYWQFYSELTLCDRLLMCSDTKSTSQGGPTQAP